MSNSSCCFCSTVCSSCSNSSLCCVDDIPINGCISIGCSCSSMSATLALTALLLLLLLASVRRLLSLSAVAVAVDSVVLEAAVLTIHAATHCFNRLKQVSQSKLVAANCCTLLQMLYCVTVTATTAVTAAEFRLLRARKHCQCSAVLKLVLYKRCPPVATDTFASYCSSAMSLLYTSAAADAPAVAKFDCKNSTVVHTYSTLYCCSAIAATLLHCGLRWQQWLPCYQLLR
jgi:uncharacterized protein (TIGR03382 family)